MKRLLPLLLAATFSAAVASPTAPVVVAGQATFNQQGNVFTITNTPNTVINWQSFSIAPGEVTRFVQQSASSAVLNRILGQDPTQILGALQSNGQVFLINPNGVMFGKDARIDVAGLTASTLNLTDADFLAGRRNFTAGPNAGSISNQGAISAQPGGHVFLIAPNVENSGIISAPNGDVVLAAGRQVQLVDSRDPDMHVVVSAPEDKAVNLGQVISQGGRIGIYGALVKQRGEVNANSAVVGQNGKIVLKASGDTLLEEGSKTTATGAGNGGSVHVLGNRVAMTGNAQVDVSGGANGGTVLMGGDYKGSNPLYASAQQTWLGRDASIRANAGANGKGGKVILWATDATRAFGSISARGGAVSGDGGFIETSADDLNVSGVRIDAGAVNGTNGSWLLDPLNITVGLPSCSIGEDCVNVSAADARVFDLVPAQTGLISVADLLSASGTDILLQAKNNIRFNDTLNAGSKSITAEAGNSITVDAPITTTGGAIKLSANHLSSNSASGNGGVIVNSHIRSNGGEITLVGKHATLASTGSIDSGAANVNFTVDRLTLGSYVNAGTVNGSNLVTIMPFTSGRGIVMGSNQSANTGVLYLTNNEIGNLHASQVRIGDAVNTGSISWDWTGIYSSAGFRTLSLRTPGAITVNNLIELQDVASHMELHSGSLNITGSGSLKANNVTLRADAMSIGGTVKGNEAVRLLQNSAGTHVAVGNAAEVAGQLTIDGTELGKVSAPKVVVGDAEGEAGVTVSNLGYAPAGAGSLTVESGYGAMSVNGAVSANGSLTLSGSSVAIASGGSVSAPDVTLRANQMDIGGTVSATTIKVLPKYAAQSVTVGSLFMGIEGALEISESELANLVSPSLVIGDSTQSGSIHVGTLNRTGNLTIDSGVGLLGIDGAVVASGALALQSENDLAIAGTGSVEAADVTLRADHMAIGGSVKGTSSIKVTPGTSTQHIQLGGEPSENEYSLTLNNNELAQMVSPNLYIGDWNLIGGVTIDSMAYTHAGAGKLTIDAGMASMNIDGYATTSGTLALKAGSSIYQSPVTGTDNNAITTPLLHLEGNGEYGLSIGLIDGSANMIDKLTGTNLRDLHVLNGKDLTVGDGVIGLHYLDDLDYNGLEIALSNSGKLTVQNTIDVNTGYIDIEAGSLQIGLPVDSSGNSSGTTTASIQGGSLNLELNGAGGISMSKGSLLSGQYIDIVADKFQLEQGARIDSPGISGHVFITPYSDLARIELGSGAVDSISGGLVTLGLSEVELQAIDTSYIAIGNYYEGEPGLVSVVGSLDLSAAPRLESLGIYIGNAGMEVRSGASLIGPRSVYIQSTSPSALGGDVIVNGLLEARKIEVMEDESVHNSGVVSIESKSVRGTGLIKASFAFLDTENGIGTADTPLDLQVTGLWAQNTLYEAGAPINIRNNYNVSTPSHLVVAGLHQYGDGIGSIRLETWGGMTIVDQNSEYPTTAAVTSTSTSTSTTLEPTVHTKSGSISLVTHSPMNVEGIVQSTTGAISLEAADGGTLTVSSTGKVQSETGNITLTAGTLNVADGTVATTGTVTQNGSVSNNLPTLAQCIADRTLPGCAEVLPSLSICIANKATPGCEAVLPTLEACVANKTTAGCEVVLPTLAACIANYATPGCEVILPSLEACVANKATPGCEVVLPSLEVCVTNKSAPGCEAVLPDLAACVADKTTAGCEVVLPNLATCIADKTTAGCEVVLPSLTACMADKTIAGCEVVLPNLAACIADKTAPGCDKVLPSLTACIADKTIAGCDVVLPNLTACIADKTTAGCEAVLPTLAACIANKATAGCEAVLPSLAACVVDKTAAGCEVVLPDVSVCIADKTAPGCEAVLPQLAACIADKTIAGCSVVLPSIATCVADKSTPGCEVVLPTLAACIADKSIAGCQAVLPELSACIADKTAPGCDAVLPNLAACIADKTAAGCEVILPNLAACIANKATAGCEVVLPNLAACIANKATAGCEVVLPNLATCIANKATPGCEAVLPDVTACIANKGTPGCEVVLPDLAACIANKGTPGCEVVLPNLAACIANKATPGCEVVLPNLAACIANKATPGCEVVLPNLATCIANKSTAGCEVVLPDLTACIANKATPGCEVVLPNMATCIANKATPGCEAVLPNMAACIANKATEGCDAVLPNLATCIANKATAGCEVVLPNLAACIADKATAGCEVVLPNLAACIANKATAGCEVVLPDLAACIANKGTPGCEVVLPNMAACIADKTTAGCEAVLPKLAACIANKAAEGCEVVLPKLAACIADKATPGCEVVLPNLAACVADKTQPGCEVVLPTMAACIANKATAGCEVILPPLAACIADKTAAGCEVVLPTIAQCVANPTLGGCEVMLPTLAQCIADKSRPGCTVILPTMAECIGSPSLPGCAVVLPSLAQCAVNPNQQGCEAVLPQPDFCATHPTDPRCLVFNPGGQQSGQEKAPVAEAVQTSVTLINSKTPQQGQSTPGSTSDQASSGQSGQQQGEPEKQAEKEQGTAPADNSGVKNEKPATKLYCN